MSRSYASVPFPTQGGTQGASTYSQGHSYSHSQPSNYAPQPPPPQTYGGASAQQQQTTPIQPGSLTYTTTRNSQGETVYHAFIAQAVNYQTPEGIVQGIKWVPADSVRGGGGSSDPSQQSGPDFGDEGGVYVPQPDVRGMSEKQKEKAMKAWQKENRKEAEKRQRKMEKEQEKQWENEERERIRAEAKEKKDRERRMSSGNGIAFDRGAAGLERQRSVGAFERERERKISTGYGKEKGDRGRGGEWERERTTSGGMLGLSRARSQSRSRKASIHGEFDTGRAGGGYESRSAGYGAAGYEAPSGTGSAYPYVNTTVLPPRYGDQPSPSGYPSSNLPPASPGHGSRGSQGYPSASKQPSPGGHSPYMGGGQFPPSHPMHRSTQSEGGGGFHRPPAGGGSSYGHQAFGPVDINREPNRALPYTWFEPFIVIPDMNQFFTHTAFPIMPAVMQPHDVTHDEWISFVKDIMTVWTRRGSINDARITRLAAEVAEIIETWVGIYFQPRGVELVLFRGRERRSGPYKGRTEERLPLPTAPRHRGRHEESESESSSLSSSSESDDDEQDRYRYGAYSARVGVTGDHPSMRQLQEMRYQRKAARAAKKAEKRRRARERKQRRERDQIYSIGIFCTSQRGAAAAGHQGMPPAEYGGRPSPQEYARYGATPSGTPMSQPSMGGGAHDPYTKYVPVSHGSTAIPPLGSQTPYSKYVDTSKSNAYQSSPGGHAML